MKFFLFVIYFSHQYFKYDLTTLWNAGKEYNRGKILSDFIGKNEKTKIICKFSKKGQGAPVREPLVDKETQSKMLAYYFKKQEEQKVIFKFQLYVYTYIFFYSSSASLFTLL